MNPMIDSILLVKISSFFRFLCGTFCSVNRCVFSWLPEPLIVLFLYVFMFTWWSFVCVTAEVKVQTRLVWGIFVVFIPSYTSMSLSKVFLDLSDSSVWPWTHIYITFILSIWFVAARRLVFSMGLGYGFPATPIFLLWLWYHRWSSVVTRGAYLQMNLSPVLQWSLVAAHVGVLALVSFVHNVR